MSHVSSGVDLNVVWMGAAFVSDVCSELQIHSIVDTIYMFKIFQRWHFHLGLNRFQRDLDLSLGCYWIRFRSIFIKTKYLMYITNDLRFFNAYCSELIIYNEYVISVFN